MDVRLSRRATATPVSVLVEVGRVSASNDRISLRIDYRRNLDPAWYFHPLQQFAMGKMAEFFIEQVMVRG